MASIEDYCSLVISCCAATFTLYQAHLERRHNKISVRPHIQRVRRFEEEAGFVTYSKCYQNFALGPAIVKSVEVRFEEVRQDMTPASAFEDLLAHVLRSLPARVVSASFPTQGFIIRAEGEYEIFRVRYSATASEQVVEKLEKLHFIIRYESLYGETFTFDSKKTPALFTD